MKPPFERLPLPALVLMVGLALTALGTKLTQDRLNAEEAQIFDRLSERVRGAVAGRLDDHARVLKGLRGLFATGAEVDRPRFRRYVDGLGIEANPGALGYGFVRYVPRAGLADFVRREAARSPGFAVTSWSGESDLFVIQYIEPLEKNRPALGLDLGGEAKRRAAIEASVERAEVTISQRIQLVQDEKRLSGLLMLLPIFATPDAAAAPSAERWRQVRGWVYAPIRVDDLFEGIDEQTDGLIDFELFEDDAVSLSNLLFDADRHLAELGTRAYGTGRYAGRRQSRLIEMPAGGRQWFLQVSSNREFDRVVHSHAAFGVLFGGIVCSLLVAGLLSASRQTTLKATQLAERMTASLRASESGLRDALRQLEQQQRALDTHSIVAMTDVRGTITYVNDKLCAISGYRRDELIGANHRLLNSGHHSPGFFRDMYRTIARGRVWQGDICNRAKDGRLYWVDTSIVPFLNEAGKPVKYVSIRTDITAHKAAEAELKRHRDHLKDIVDVRTAELQDALQAAESGNRAKSAFISNMSHELRTPMHGILALAEMGLRRAAQLPPDKVADYFGRIRDSAQRLMRLVNDVLDFSKLGAEKMRFELAPVDLAVIAAELVLELEVQAEQRGQRIQFEQGGTLPPVLADSHRIMQVLRNLLVNALKFSPEGGVVSIAFGAARLTRGSEIVPAVCVEVSDQGVGIPEGELESIFEHFVQSSKTSTGAGGTGLGLAICRQIVEAHGGWIKARNNPQGGATFSFVLAQAGVAHAG